jgi:hypothetical protein
MFRLALQGAIQVAAIPTRGPIFDARPRISAKPRPAVRDRRESELSLRSELNTKIDPALSIAVASEAPVNEVIE